MPCLHQHSISLWLLFLFFLLLLWPLCEAFLARVKNFSSQKESEKMHCLPRRRSHSLQTIAHRPQFVRLCHCLCPKPAPLAALMFTDTNCAKVIVFPQSGSRILSNGTVLMLGIQPARLLLLPSVTHPTEGGNVIPATTAPETHFLGGN